MSGLFADGSGHLDLWGAEAVRAYFERDPATSPAPGAEGESGAQGVAVPEPTVSAVSAVLAGSAADHPGIGSFLAFVDDVAFIDEPVGASDEEQASFARTLLQHLDRAQVAAGGGGVRRRNVFLRSLRRITKLETRVENLQQQDAPATEPAADVVIGPRASVTVLVPDDHGSVGSLRSAAELLAEKVEVTVRTFTAENADAVVSGLVADGSGHLDLWGAEAVRAYFERDPATSPAPGAKGESGAQGVAVPEPTVSAVSAVLAGSAADHPGIGSFLAFVDDVAFIDEPVGASDEEQAAFARTLLQHLDRAQVAAGGGGVRRRNVFLRSLRRITKLETRVENLQQQDAPATEPAADVVTGPRASVTVLVPDDHGSVGSLRSAAELLAEKVEVTVRTFTAENADAVVSGLVADGSGHLDLWGAEAVRAYFERDPATTPAPGAEGESGAQGVAVPEPTVSAVSALAGSAADHAGIGSFLAFVDDVAFIDEPVGASDEELASFARTLLQHLDRAQVAAGGGGVGDATSSCGVCAGSRSSRLVLRTSSNRMPPLPSRRLMW